MSQKSAMMAIMTAPARGRPRVQDMADDIVASVLATAGARVSTPDFSTRRVAELTGLSQTLVSRSFRRLRRVAAPRGTEAAGTAEPVVLSEVSVRFPQIRVRFDAADAAEGATPEAPPPGGARAGRARAARARAGGADTERRATALMAALRVSEAGTWRVRGATGRRDVAAAPSAAMTTSTSRSSPTVPDSPASPTAPDSPASPIPAHAPEALWDPRQKQSWEQFLDHVAALLSRCEPGPDTVPGDLLDLLARRAGRGLHGVQWRRTSEPTEIRLNSDSEESGDPGLMEPERSPRNTWFAQVELSVTEQIAIALRKEITNSGFRAGDKLSPAALADRLGLRRAVVRSAMLRLVDDGLLDLDQGSFRIPAVTGADVVDLYAARLHVGMVLLRACTVQPRHRLLPARLALGAVEAAASQGTRSDVGLADLQFQQELAEASGLGQSARAFHALTLRVRMFIAVLQLDYSPAVERIVSDDRRILSAVLAGDAESAVRAWRLKLDNAVRHMSALAPESFDAELWSRLSH
ncbi:GntR family transcriptional regulator [Nesterenkonia sp. Act20]|uniref:GntR family transcriptional regulator n=1 Tax=Nesterenkonia sp. Act20 TaxID=1483432 RepID=UPI001C461122|nr:GntR family transcriptional regulator [Nesterenkonia sp. Act20]